jgi:uncharacterized protein (TIGR02453 family)
MSIFQNPHIMLQSATLEFLRQLKKHNDKAWFDENRKAYEAAKADFEEFVDALLKALVALEPALAGQKAKDCIHRIFRDVRFSKDKSPYKSNFGAVFARGGRKWEGAAYYLHVEPGGHFAGGGLWQPEPPVLKAVRQEIDYGFADFEAIIHDKAFKKAFPKLDGDSLQKPPQGYDATNPAIEYLKMKGWTVGAPLKDEDLTGKNAVRKVAGIFTAMKPFIDFLNRAVK